MSKKIIALAIATAIIILCFVGCSKTSSPAETTTAATTTAVLYTTPATTTFYDTFDNTVFVSEEAKRVFTVIREEKQYTEEGFAIITDYLRNNPSEEVIDDFNNSEYHWKLGGNCTLIVGTSRTLELESSKEKVTVITNVDTLLVNETPEYLNDWNYGQNGFQNSWLVSDMTFYDGFFYSFGEIIFDATPPVDSDTETALIGSTTSTDGTTFIVAKHNNKIVLIKEKEHEFTHEVIADDAVSAPEKISFNRTDRYISDTDQDAVMRGRSLFYRTENQELIQVDITDDGVKSTTLFEDFEDYNLLYDYSGVYWLRTADLAEKSLTDLLHLAEYPDHYMSRDGDIMEYSPSGN
ncbi:MAG: hypothetical protein IJN50_02120 [Clostridia bacterium]|nr:hypothetical protein [Clostridia bacterium]